MIAAQHYVTNSPQVDEPETKPTNCKKFAEQSLKDPHFSMLPWSPGQLKVGKFSGKHWGKGQTLESFQFQIEPGQFNCSAELAAETPPQIDDEILVAGFPEADFDIGGMSGGAMIWLCSGKVVGAVSGQDFDEVCPKQRNPNQLVSVPVGLGPKGDLELDLQRPLVPSQCVSTAGTYGLRQSATSKKCQVLPADFDLAPAEAPRTVK